MDTKATFKRKALPIYLFGVIAYYLGTGLMNDHVNILQPYYAETYHWSALTITNPITVASYAVIPLAVVFGILYYKFPANRLMGICTLLLGAGTIGIGLANDNVVLYSICLFVVRIMVISLVLGVQNMCTNWFIETRGRAFGIVTMGGPLCSASLVAILTASVGSALGFHGTYLVLGAIVVVVGIVFLVGIKGSPEQCGLHPDGAAEAPASALVKDDKKNNMLVKTVLSKVDTYLIIVGIGLLWLSLIGFMAFFVVRMSAVGTAAPVYLSTLTISALLGVALSYVVGIVDDKAGTPAAFLLVCGFNLLAAICLLFVRGNNIVLIGGAALGIAGMTGGLQNIQPSIISYIYGRDNFAVVNGWLYAFESIFSAFGVFYMSAILDATGTLDMAYIGMIVMTVIAALCVVVLWKRNPQPVDSQ